ncbi:SpoIIE family protein phosphatase [Streptomyces sp. NPDC047108]|uniref:ATP-binding SpoIIE family protein phosphatase n=1 Tax=Streptomyces sp. NPDC047108 TaxID=3155025 RepID=UPI0033C8E757
MRTEDVLSAIATGLWRWNSASGEVSLDAEAARLLGLPAVPVRLSQSAVRSRFHPVDWVEIQGVINLSLAEGTLAEARLRIMTDDGKVQRIVRSRSRQYLRGEGYELVGTLQEVPEPQPGTASAAVHSRVTGDWRRSREAFLLDAGRALAEARSTAEVLRVAATLSMPGFTPDGLAVFGVEGDRLKIIGYHGYQQGDEGPFLHMSVDTEYPAAEVVRNGRAIYLPSPEEYAKRFPSTWPLARRFHRKSWAFIPLVVGGRTMGAWMAAFSYPVAFTPDERSVLTTVARMLAQALSRAGVQETERELATGLQRSMMPTVQPDIPGMSVAARYVPTGGGLQVGGDWYDMIPLPSGRIALVIGDVQGHDVRAAGLMGQLRIALRAYAAEGHHPDAVLSRASRFLAGLAEQWPDGDDGGITEGRFATCLYIEVDPESGTLDIARAGHPDIATRMSDGTMLVRPTAGGLPLGIDPDSDYPTTRLTLEPGELMMVCTDGLIETGGHDIETGWQRLRDAIESHEGTMESLADALVQAVHGPSSHHSTGPLADRREDDIAVLLLRRDPIEVGCDPVEGTAPRPIRRTVLSVPQTEPEQVAIVRRQLRELMHDWGDNEQVDAAVLMISEMASNVLLHTDGDALIIAEIVGRRGARRLRVDVADPSDELPHLRRPGEMASSGRGLVLMEMLAESWGVDPRGEGKCTWFELYEPGSAEEEFEGEPAA